MPRHLNHNSIIEVDISHIVDTYIPKVLIVRGEDQLEEWFGNPQTLAEWADTHEVFVCYFVYDAKKLHSWEGVCSDHVVRPILMSGVPVIEREGFISDYMTKMLGGTCANAFEYVRFEDYADD